jgi:DHA1 family tetracycline resistance protein-like MFS transporter
MLPPTPPWPARRPELLGLLLFFCAGLADGAIVPFFPLWAHDEAGIAVGVIGLLFGCYAGGELLATPMLGGIADRVGRRPVLIASSLGVGLGFLALPLAHSALQAALILVIVGVFESALHPTILAVIADVTPDEQHRKSFGAARAASSAGHVVGPALGALLAKASLGAVFAAGGVAMLVGGTLMLLGLPETRLAAAGAETETEEEDEEESLSALLPAFKDARLALLLGWFLMLEISGSWIEAVLPLSAHEAGLSASSVGLLFTYGAALVATAQMLVSQLMARRSGMALVLSAGAALVAAFSVLLAGVTPATLILAVTLHALAQMLAGPLAPTLVNQLATSDKRATYMAAASVASDLRDSVGPATGTALYAAAARLPWILGIPFALLSAIGLTMTIARQHGPRPPRRTAEEPSPEANPTCASPIRIVTPR